MDSIVHDYMIKVSRKVVVDNAIPENIVVIQHFTVTN